MLHKNTTHAEDKETSPQIAEDPSLASSDVPHIVHTHKAPKNFFTLRHFSKKRSLKRIIPFVLIFGSIGTYFLWHSFAAVPIVATLEAEKMTMPASVAIINDSSASAGQAIKFSAKDTASNPLLPLTDKVTSMTLRARADQCGATPNLDVTIDGSLVKSQPVAATGWTDYTLSTNLNLIAGNHSVSIQFTNPAIQTVGNSGKLRCKSAMYVDKMVFYGPDNNSAIITLNDSTLGSGANQFQYTGTWTANGDAPAYMGDQHYTNTSNDSYQTIFSGTQARLYSTTASHHGIAGISIDGGAETMVDFYSVNRTNQVLLYTSPILAPGSHTLKLRDTGLKNVNSTGTYIVADRLDVSTDTSTPPAPLTATMKVPVNGAPVTGGIPVEATATGPGGVVQKVDFYLDNTTLVKSESIAPYCMGSDSGVAPCYNWDSTTVTNGIHTITAYAYDANNNRSLGSTVSFNVNNPTTAVGCPSGFAPFPSRLKTSGRNLVDENGCVMPKMKGFSIHAATLSYPDFVFNQSNFDDIYSHGGRVLRTVVSWEAYEPTQGTGTLSSTNLTALDEHIRRAAADHDPNTPGVQGLYVMLELHLNTGSIPAWVKSGAGNDETEKYVLYGQNFTQTLAKRNGSNKAVLGFGLNEPPQDNTTMAGNNSIPTFEAQQRQMISWFRNPGVPGYAPDWIGFVTLAYANQKPYVAAPRISASPTAYAPVGGNVVFDAHDYLSYNDSTDPNNDSRQANGGLSDTSHGGTAHWMGLADPNSYVHSDTHLSQMKAYLAPFNTYADAAQMPLMLGEFGWNIIPNGTGTPKSQYYADKTIAMNAQHAALEMNWIYGESASTQDPWVAKPYGVWDNDILTWLNNKSSP